MLVKLVVDSMTARTTTDSQGTFGFFNTDDEVFFSAIGSTTNGRTASKIEIPRISPPPSQDYFAFAKGQTRNNITLLQQNLDTGEGMELGIAVAEQDNAQLPGLILAAKAAAEYATAALLPLLAPVPGVGQFAVAGATLLGAAATANLKAATVSLYNSIGQRSDDTIGAFNSTVVNAGQSAEVHWRAPAGTSTRLLAPDGTELADGAESIGPSATFHATGSRGDYTFTVKAVTDSPTYVGTSGNDRLSGGAADDRMDGGEGNDAIYGGSGNDVLFGGNGNDYIDGWEGNDYLDGGNGDDVLVSWKGNDTIYGGSGNDWLDGSYDNDLLYGGAGNDTLGNPVSREGSGGEPGNDSMYGGDGNDGLYGGDGNDILDGGADNDTLTGGSGNDILTGGAGNDILIGGLGNDTLTSGIGSNVFKFNSTNEGTDTITDFSSSFDDIQVVRSGFGNILSLGTISSAQFHLGSSATASGDRFIYNQSTGGLFFDKDGKGGSAQVQIATLSSKPSLGFSDILVVA